MKRGFYLIAILSLLFGCGEDEVGFTSLIGSWTYTTPDEKIKVEFDIVGGDPEILAVINQKIFVEGEEGAAAVQTEVVTETTFGRLRINANDANLVRPYNIIFTNLKANADFSLIEVESATYTFPWPDEHELTNVKIMRR